MGNIQEIIASNSKIEHDLEHDSEHIKLFSNPKISAAKRILSNCWCKYFLIRNLKTDKIDRMQNIYGKTNLYKT